MKFGIIVASYAVPFIGDLKTRRRTLPLASSSTFPPTTSETLDGTASSLLSAPVACSADNACIMEEIDLHTLHYLEKYPTLDPTPKRANSTAQSNQLDSCGGNYADTGIFQVICEV